eukprot:5380800-Amphidinium_carterae.1
MNKCVFQEAGLVKSGLIRSSSTSYCNREIDVRCHEVALVSTCIILQVAHLCHLTNSRVFRITADTKRREQQKHKTMPEHKCFQRESMPGYRI